MDEYDYLFTLAFVLAWPQQKYSRWRVVSDALLHEAEANTIYGFDALQAMPAGVEQDVRRRFS